MLTAVPEIETAVGSMSWVDRNQLWLFAWTKRETGSHAIASARSLIVRRYDSILRIVKNLSKSAEDIAAVELRLLCDTSIPMSELVVGPRYETLMTGKTELWSSVDPCFIARGSKGSVILQYRPDKGDVREITLDWWIDGTYDVLYQDLADCLTLPELGILIVTLQRCSDLIIIDLNDNKKIGSVPLAGRSGGPILTRLDDDRIATVDYDTLCCVDVASKELVNRVLVQPEVDAVRRFTGPISAVASGLLIARPFSGDVILFDSETLAEKARAATGGKPIDAIEIAGARVLARDWKTGAVLSGSFKSSEMEIGELPDK